MGSRGPAGFRTNAYPKYLNLDSSQTNMSLYINRLDSNEEASGTGTLRMEMKELEEIKLIN